MRDGYILINPVTGRKFFLYNHTDLKNLQKVVNTNTFWEGYRTEKDLDSSLFKDYYKPLYRRYSTAKEDIKKKALNFPVQGTASEVTKVAAYLIFQNIYNRGLLFKVFMSNIIHDELLLETSEDLVENIASVVESSMKKAGKLLGMERVPLDASAKIVDWWNH